MCCREEVSVKLDSLLITPEGGLREHRSNALCAHIYGSY